MDVKIEQQQQQPPAMLTIVDEELEDEDELALMSNNYDEFSSNDNNETNQRLNGAGQLAAHSKRKEKARIAARARRSQEATIIMEMAAELQITQEKMRRIDKATIVKLAIDYIRAHEILCQQPTTNDRREDELLSKNSMIEQQQQQQLVDDNKLTQENEEEEEEEEEEKVLEENEERSFLMSCVKCGERAKPATMRSTMGEINSNCGGGSGKNMTRLLSTCCSSVMTAIANEDSGEQQQDDGGILKEKIIEVSKQRYEEDEDDDNNLGNDFKENNNNNNQNEYQEHKQPLYSAPKLSTASIFAPKTDDNMNSYFLMIEEKANGKSEFILKPDTEIHDDDDLTHLAPQAGDMSISFETDPLDGIPIDDLLIPSPPAASNQGEQRYQNNSNNITINVQGDDTDELEVAANFNVFRRINSSSLTMMTAGNTVHYNNNNKGAPPMAIPSARPRVVNSGCLCVGGGPPTATNLMAHKSHHYSMVKNCIPSFTSATLNENARHHHHHHVNMHLPVKPSRVSGSTSPPMKKLHWATSLDDYDDDDNDDSGGGGGTAEGRQQKQQQQQRRDEGREDVNGDENIILYHKYHQQKAHNHHPINYNNNNQCNRRRRFESLYHNSNSHTFANTNFVNNHQYRPVNFVYQQQQQQQQHQQQQRLI